MTAAPSCFAPDVLAGRVALVTGGATGIGKEICRVLGAHGAHVAMASRTAERLEAAVEELRTEGIDASFGVCDVRDPDAVRSVVDGVVADHGGLDIVVNNAAGNFPAPMSTISPNGFKAIVDIDLLGTYNVTRAAFDAWLRDHGGSIVNITAPFEQRGVVFQAHVAAAKSGVDSLTRTCAVEWGPYGIRVNAIAPGSMRGPRGSARFAEAVPARRRAPHQPARDPRARLRHRLPGTLPVQPGGPFRLRPGHRRGRRRVDRHAADAGRGRSEPGYGRIREIPGRVPAGAVSRPSASARPARRALRSSRGSMTSS